MWIPLPGSMKNVQIACDHVSDTSFLIKAYVPEQESAQVVSIIAGLQGDGAISRLTDVEIASSLHRKLLPQDVGKVYRDYLLDRGSNTYQELGIDDQVFELAKTLAERHAHQFQLRSIGYHASGCRSASR